MCVCMCVSICVFACPSSGLAAVCLSAALALCALGVSGCTEPHGDEEACRVRRHMNGTDEHMKNTDEHMKNIDEHMMNTDEHMMNR